jgi:RNA polymerase sigma factor (sigma-70 family)
MAGANISSDAADDDSDSIRLSLEQLKGGDPRAAQHLWDRYYGRLIALARKKLGDSSRRGMDENDVVQTAFTGFCLRAQAGGFPNLKDREGLWALLAVMTARAAANQRLHEGRLKRGSGRVGSTAREEHSGEWQLMDVISQRPSAEDAAIFVAQLEHFMDSLDDPSDRLILLWKLEERTNPEIAKYLDCSLSAIERKLRSIRRRLKQNLPQTNTDVE